MNPQPDTDVTLKELVTALSSATGHHPGFDWATDAASLPQDSRYTIRPNPNNGGPTVWLRQNLTGNETFTALIDAVAELDHTAPVIHIRPAVIGHHAEDSYAAGS